MNVLESAGHGNHLNWDIELCRHIKVWLHFPESSESVGDYHVSAKCQFLSGSVLAPFMSIGKLIGIEGVITIVIGEILIGLQVDESEETEKPSES